MNLGIWVYMFYHFIPNFGSGLIFSIMLHPDYKTVLFYFNQHLEPTYPSKGNCKKRVPNGIEKLNIFIKFSIPMATF